MPYRITLPVTCPTCGAGGRVSPVFAGRPVTCTRCRRSLVVPGRFDPPGGGLGGDGRPARRWSVPAGIALMAVLALLFA